MSPENDGFILDQFIDIDNYVWTKLKKDKKLLKNRRRENTYDENIYDTAYRIDRKYHYILKVILNNPDLNIKRIGEMYLNHVSIVKKNRNSSSVKHNRYRKIERMIKDLENVHLIERVESKRTPIGNFEKKDAPYRLTIHGMFFVLLNDEFIGLFEVVGSLLNNYPKNEIYQIFLYPYFEKESLEEVGDYLFPPHKLVSKRYFKNDHSKDTALVNARGKYDRWSYSNPDILMAKERKYNY